VGQTSINCIDKTSWENY